MYMCIRQTVMVQSICPPYGHAFCGDDVTVAVAVVLLLLVVLGKGTNDSVCVAFAVPLVLYVALTGSLPSAITKCACALSNNANDARGW